ncbi:MAG: 4Fe-4S binding protein [Deltaproteobacteria bacterium]|nr:4Fe-4S binding protein [Deltaproteobacteria bacterium]
MTLFTIDREKCNRDGICVDSCPSRIIELSDGSPGCRPGTQQV